MWKFFSRTYVPIFSKGEYLNRTIFETNGKIFLQNKNFPFLLDKTAWQQIYDGKIVRMHKKNSRVLSVVSAKRDSGRTRKITKHTKFCWTATATLMHVGVESNIFSFSWLVSGVREMFDNCETFSQLLKS